MAANSAKESAPNRLSTPVTIHTARPARALPTSPVIAEGTMKMAEPIMMPTTIAVACHNPSARKSCGLLSAAVLAGSEAFSGVIRESFERWDYNDARHHTPCVRIGSIGELL